MQEAKNTARSLVKIAFDGSVHKIYRATGAADRFENELRVLQFLERRGCDFVPRVIRFDRDELLLVTTNCGQRVQQISDEKLKDLFGELERFGVRHDDPFLRNVTYRAMDGRFCIIDFEFATIIDEQAAEAVGISTVGASDGAQTSSSRSAFFDSPTPQNIALQWSGLTDRGKFRPNNEDAFLAISCDRGDLYYLGRVGEAPARGRDFVFGVSDGMGGERSGEFASRFALQAVTRLMPRRFALLPSDRGVGIRECLHELFIASHCQLTTLGQSYEQGRGMGATLSVLWYASGHMYFGHIGDSRIYYLPRDGAMRQLTEDHTHVGWLRRNGKVNEREARFHPRKNVLTQSLGAGAQYIHPQLGELKCDPGDRFLLVTDGVVDGLWDRGLEELIREPPPEQAIVPAAERIVRAAVEASGRDNATAVVVEVVSHVSQQYLES